MSLMKWLSKCKSKSANTGNDVDAELDSARVLSSISDSVIEVVTTSQVPIINIHEDHSDEFDELSQATASLEDEIEGPSQPKKVRFGTSAVNEPTSATTCNDIDNSGKDSTSPDAPYPDCWTNKMYIEKCGAYTWLFALKKALGCNTCKSVKSVTSSALGKGIRVSKEWSECTVLPFGQTRKEKQQSLRKKMHDHKNSAGHTEATAVLEHAKKETLVNVLAEQESASFLLTDRVFRTAYTLAKNGRPFTDLPNYVELQQLNGLGMGRTNHSDHACAKIIDHIGTEMKKKVFKHIIENSSKIGILIDESTTVSHKATLVICLRAAPEPGDKPLMFFMDLIQLKFATADYISNTVLSTLKHHGFTEEYLQRNWISFATDGASVMLGRKSGVAAIMKRKFPSLVVWHCSNHRLELAVGDVMKIIPGINHFQQFIDKLYSVYSVSTKNVEELKVCAKELDISLLSIGKVLGTRWVASSERTVKAVWNNYAALYQHFSSAEHDLSRSTTERSKYSGLKRRLSDAGFIVNLGLMYDALRELAALSLQLQSKEITLPAAHRQIDITVRVIESMINRHGEHLSEALSATDPNIMLFKTVKVESNSKGVVQINPAQFFRSLADNMTSRMFTTKASHLSSNADDREDREIYSDLMSQLDALDSSTWPVDANNVDSLRSTDIQHGDKEVRALCRRFGVDESEAIIGYRNFKSNIHTSKVIPSQLKSLKTAVDTLVVSTSDCERSFSTMNTTITSIRNSLAIERVSHLIFIQLVGPPLSLFKPEMYVRKWLANGNRTADHAACRGTENKEESSSLKPLWDLL